jgi:hypothetical protein
MGVRRNSTKQKHVQSANLQRIKADFGNKFLIDQQLSDLGM